MCFGNALAPFYYLPVPFLDRPSRALRHFNGLLRKQFRTNAQVSSSIQHLQTKYDKIPNCNTRLLHRSPQQQKFSSRIRHESLSLRNYISSEAAPSAEQFKHLTTFHVYKLHLHTGDSLETLGHFPRDYANANNSRPPIAEQTSARTTKSAEACADQISQLRY